MGVNLHKHACAGNGCVRVANVMAMDGTSAYFLCVGCSRHATVQRHIKRYGGKILPASETVCLMGCKG